MRDHWQTASFPGLDHLELYAVLRLRQEVFVVEQNCVYLDLDGLDQQADHILYWREGQLLGYLRCLPPGLSYPESSLGRIVISKAARGLQLGRSLVQQGIDHNLRHWPGIDIRINAQAYLGDFYTSLGFRADGPDYDEDGIMHRQMLYVIAPAET